MQTFDIVTFEKALPEKAPVAQPQSSPAAKLPADDYAQRKARAVLYAGNVRGAMEGQRNHEAYALGARLRDKFGIDGADLLEVVQLWNNKNTPPLDDAELADAVSNAGKYAQRPAGSGYEPAKATTTASGMFILDDDNPRTIAIAYEQWSIVTCNVKHRYHPQDGWTIYRDGKYQQVDPKQQIAKYLSDFCEMCSCLKGKSTQRIRLSSSKINDVLQQLSYLDGVYLRPSQAAPCSLDGSLDTERVIAVDNGLLDWSSYPYTLHEPTELYYTLNYLPYRWDGEKDSEIWIHYLMDVTNGDVELLDLLQMWAGYCLIPKLKMKQKFLLIQGEADTGKSVFCDILCAIMGAANISSVPLAKFDDPHYIVESFGKFLNLSDESEEMLLDRAVENNLKHYTGGTPYQWKRLYQPSFSAYPTAKIMISTNHLPKFTDSSEGIWTRLLLAPFNVRFSEDQQDKTIKERIKATELPGVLAWALEGARKLQANNYQFVIPEVSKAAVEDYRRDVMPEIAFLEENFSACTPGDSLLGVKCKVFRRCYEEWCQENGIKPKSAKRLAPLIRKMFPASSRGYARYGDNRDYFYDGIKMDTESVFFRSTENA